MANLANIKKLIYDPMFEGVYSKQFFRNVLLNNYAPYINSPYSLVYFDVNNLGKVTNSLIDKHGDAKMGRAEADEGFTYLIELFRRYFPGNITLSRIGGDEFVAFVPNKTAEQCQTHIDALNAKIAISDTELTKGLSLTLAADDSRFHDTTYNMLLSASASAEKIKIGNKSEGLLERREGETYDEHISRVIDVFVEEFFKELKISKHSVNIQGPEGEEFFKKVVLAFTNLVLRKKEMGDAKEPIITRDKLSQVPLNRPEETLGQEDLEFINDILTNENAIRDQEKLAKLRGILSKDHLTGFLSRSYFETFMLDHLNSQIRINERESCMIYIDTVGIKLCNTVLGHEGTDEILKGISESIRGEQQRRRRERREEQDRKEEEIEGQEKRGPDRRGQDRRRQERMNNDCVIDYGGGNIVVILPDTKLEHAHMVCERGLARIAEKDANRLLPLVTSVRRLNDSKSFEEAIASAQEEILALKGPIKHQQLFNNPNIGPALEIVLLRTVEEFYRWSDDPNSIELQREFLEKIRQSAIRYGTVKSDAEQKER